MHVTLRGSSPGVHTAGILLLTRARQLGLPLLVEVVGDPDDLASVPGPAVVYAPVLASCGVGREEGSGATVVVPGPPGSTVLASVVPHGASGWFPVDRTGKGAHPATRAYARMSRDARATVRDLTRTLRRAMSALGMSTDPAVLDVLFGAHVPTLTRLSVALRMGRALSGGRGQPVTRYLGASPAEYRDPLPAAFDPETFRAGLAEGAYGWILDALSPAVRDQVEDFADGLAAVAQDDEGALHLLYALTEITSHLVHLPGHSILPPLGAAEDSVAVGLKAALAARGDGDAALQLARVYRFLGGRYVDDGGPHVLDICSEPPPADLTERWRWFAAQSRQGRKEADALWPDLVDPAN